MVLRANVLARGVSGVRPSVVQCMGGKYADDESDRQVPNVQAAQLQYDDGTMLQMDGGWVAQ